MSWDIEQVKREIRGPAGLAMATFDDELEAGRGGAEGQPAVHGGQRRGRREGVRDMSVGHGGVPVALGRGAPADDGGGAGGVRGEDGRGERRGGREPGRRDFARTDAARRAGARYAMVPPPFYYGIDQQGVFDWYRILSESVDIGVMIYDQSWRVGLGTTLTPAADREAVRAGQHRVAKVR